jgi:hypothetical protein
VAQSNFIALRGRGNRHDGADHAPPCVRGWTGPVGTFPDCDGVRGGPVARTGGAVRRRGVRRGTEGGVRVGGSGADGMRGDATAPVGLRCGSVVRLGGPARTSASSARRRCRPWVKRARMSAVSVVPRARMRLVRSLVSVRWRSEVVTPSAQRMSMRMMKSRRRVEGVAQSAPAPAGAAVGEERGAGADICGN